MLNIPRRITRLLIILPFLILGSQTVSTPAFSALFPSARIDCGATAVKLQSVKGLGNNRFYVALETGGKNVAIGQVLTDNDENTLFNLSLLCGQFGEGNPQQPTVIDGSSASIVIEPFTAGDKPIDVTGGDFNGDGHTDLAVANHGSNNISVFLNNAATGFGQPINIATGAEPRAIISGDFNKDGKTDLVTANLGNGTGSVSILLANESGTFAAPLAVEVSTSPPTLTPAAIGTSPLSLAAADFNKDGNLDVAVADSAGNVLVLHGKGDGLFQAPLALNAPGQLSILAEDVNEDGALDVITNDMVLLNDGSGNFPTATRFAEGIQSNLVRVADLDGDEILDLVTANASSNSVSIFLGRGDGSFHKPHHYIVGNGPGEIIIEDLDGNATLDIAVSNLGSVQSIVGTDHLSILLGAGDGSFTGGQAFPSTKNFYEPNNQITVADFNGDGFLDMVGTNLYGNSEPAVLKGQPFGKFADPSSLSPQNAHGVISGDFNNDTRQDLVFIQKGSPASENDAIEVRLGKGDFTFDSPTRITLPDADFALNFTLAEDIDGNGTLDLLTANTGTDDVSVFLGNGDGNFQTGLATVVGDNPRWLATGHLDGNLTLDLAVIDAGPLGGQGGKLSILFGTGSGGFSLGPEFFLNMEPNSVVIGDVNDDGKSDLAAIVQSPLSTWSVQIVLGNGQGTFGAPISISLEGDMAGNLTGYDIDLDGDLDLIMTVGPEIGILENRGDGTFQPLLLIDGGVPIGPITAIDLNHDQRPDLVIPQFRGGTTAVLLNTAEAATRISNDLNGDATADLVWRDNSTGAVALWLMKGPTKFLTGFPGGRPAEWQIAAIGDVNADGKGDILWQNTTNGLVEVWLMNGAAITSVGSPGTTSTAWVIAGACDLNGNGTADIVWHNTRTGEVALWLMKGGSIASSGFPGGVTLDWQIAACGDVNSDGKADVFWRNTTSGVVAVWFMNGLTPTSVGLPGTMPAAWVIASIGDLNGNGSADIVWHNTSTGEVALWLLNGATVSSAVVLDGVSLNWQIKKVGDVNSDGRDDFIWRDDTNGVVAIWLMNGLSISSVAFPGTAPPDWEIQ